MEPVPEPVGIKARAKTKKRKKKKPVPKPKSKPIHGPALIKTFNSSGGKIYLNELKGAYNTCTNNNPPYPAKGTVKWILSVAGIRVENGVVYLLSAARPKRGVDQQKKYAKKARESKKKKKNKKKNHGWPSLVPLPDGPKATRRQYPQRKDMVPILKGKKICILQFGFTAYSKAFRPANTRQAKMKRSRQQMGAKRPYSRAIVSGYLANKRKKAGGAKAARKARNLARLRKAHHPPADPTDHALKRYNERGSSSTPIYKDVGEGNEAIIVTYVPIRRKVLSEATRSKSTILFEVDRMNRLAKNSGLPKTKLSSRDAYLLRLSSKAVKDEECRRRSTIRDKAFRKKGPLFPAYQPYLPRYRAKKKTEKKRQPKGKRGQRGGKAVVDLTST